MYCESQASFRVGLRCGRTPPSREREIWILVSLVAREMVAVRALRDIVNYRVYVELTNLIEVGVLYGVDG